MSTLSDLLHEADQRPDDARLLQKIGDLYQRRGDHQSAAKYFARLCEVYAKDGFFLKAIALSKQVRKLDPDVIEVLARLAELHVLVGLLPEPGAYFRAARDAFARAGRKGEAASMRVRLAELGLEDEAPPTATA